MMTSRRLPSPLAVYRTVKATNNPEHPRLWPWVYRTHRANPPYTFVRNPYFWMVDTAGNQLPYVDRLHFEVKGSDLINASAAGGQLSMQRRHLRYDQYTLLMSQRRSGGYRVLHWYAADRSNFVISPNLNLHDPGRPDTDRKRALLNDKRFRQALSLAINRREIIEAEYNGQTEPAQVAPGPASLFFEPSLYHSFTEYDPERADRLLDEIGLTGRDYEGYRTFPDGLRMTFYLNLCGFLQTGPAQFVIDDWRNVGVRLVMRLRSRNYWETENAALRQDLTVWTADSEYLPLLAPRYLLPVGGGCFYAQGFAKWHDRGGLYGDPKARGAGCIEPPRGHPLRRAMEIFQEVAATGDREIQRERFREILKIGAENVWTINICTPPPQLVVVKDGFRNVPRTAVSCWNFITPGNAGIETYFFEDPRQPPDAADQIVAAIEKVTPPPDAPAAAVGGRPVGRLIKWCCLGIAVLLAVLVSVRHPYVGRRLLIMVPTLLIISVVVFTIIQLPPGDYLTSRIMELQQAGDEADLKQIQDLEQQFHLNDPVVVRYARWLGLEWFTSIRIRGTDGFPYVALTADAEKEGLLQGNLGRSMENSRPVNEIVGDRILLTVVISLGTILFTWAIAIPTGIYSAVRQYSLFDYLLTFVGFIGMCVPSFLLALVLMYLAKRYGGIEISGLFSSEYAAQPQWDWPKVADLLKHVWLPVVVLGVGGTAGMIRVMRGNLLDELRKPYVTTARAKGVRPMKLLLKYPVRLALNPFISGIGGLFPQLVSGGAIVAMVLALPTVGPKMLEALMDEDTHLAGSMLMVLSLLGVLGTLVSDLLLLWLDPRIRFKGASR
jgi:ABC-type dipeptide/oligopeptide/nickel transport system permease component